MRLTGWLALAAIANVIHLFSVTFSDGAMSDVWGSVWMIFYQHWKTLGTPLIPPKRDSLPCCGDVTKQIRWIYKEGLNIHTVVFGANKKVIKHLFRRRNKNRLFSVSAPAAEALNGSHLETLHFSFISRFFGASATACDADGSLSRLLHVPPREQLLQLTGSVYTALGHYVKTHCCFLFLKKEWR